MDQWWSDQTEPQPFAGPPQREPWTPLVYCLDIMTAWHMASVLMGQSWLEARVGHTASERYNATSRVLSDGHHRPACKTSVSCREELIEPAVASLLTGRLPLAAASLGVTPRFDGRHRMECRALGFCKGTTRVKLPQSARTGPSLSATVRPTQSPHRRFAGPQTVACSLLAT